ALADAAVRDHLLVGDDALSAVDLLQLVGALESTVLGVDGAGPRDARRGRNVAAALRAFLGQVFRGEQLTRVFLRRANVDQGDLAELVQDLLAVGADLLVRRGLAVVAGRGVPGWVSRVVS